MTEPQLTVTELKKNVSYDFRITARNRVGSGPACEELVVGGKRLSELKSFVSLLSSSDSVSANTLVWLKNKTWISYKEFSKNLLAQIHSFSWILCMNYLLFISVFGQKVQPVNTCWIPCKELLFLRLYLKSLWLPYFMRRDALPLLLKKLLSN